MRKENDRKMDELDRVIHNMFESERFITSPELAKVQRSVNNSIPVLFANPLQ